jgi:hypothetical protein
MDASAERLMVIETKIAGLAEGLPDRVGAPAVAAVQGGLEVVALAEGLMVF